jgi:hypothetical protein
MMKRRNSVGEDEFAGALSVAAAPFLMDGRIPSFSAKSTAFLGRQTPRSLSKTERLGK